MNADNEFIEPEIVHYVWDGHRLYLPYPGGDRVGSFAAAHHVTAANDAQYQVVAMKVTVLDPGCNTGHRCVMVRSSTFVEEQHLRECAICGATSP